MTEFLFFLSFRNFIFLATFSKIKYLCKHKNNSQENVNITDQQIYANKMTKLKIFIFTYDATCITLEFKTI